MTLQEVILGCEALDENLVVFARRIEGQFQASSEACLLMLTEGERDLNTKEIAKLKCPGFSYCLEMFLIQEMKHDLDECSDPLDLEGKVARILYCMEFDA